MKNITWPPPWPRKLNQFHPLCGLENWKQKRCLWAHLEEIFVLVLREGEHFSAPPGHWPKNSRSPPWPAVKKWYPLKVGPPDVNFGHSLKFVFFSCNVYLIQRAVKMILSSWMHFYPASYMLNLRMKLLYTENYIKPKGSTRINTSGLEGVNIHSLVHSIWQIFPHNRIRSLSVSTHHSKSSSFEYIMPDKCILPQWYLN